MLFRNVSCKTRVAGMGNGAGDAADEVHLSYVERIGHVEDTVGIGFPMEVWFAGCEEDEVVHFVGIELTRGLFDGGDDAIFDIDFGSKASGGLDGAREIVNVEIGGVYFGDFLGMQHLDEM